MKTKEFKYNNSYSGTNDLICPHCDEEIDDAEDEFEKTDTEQKFECQHCEKEFLGKMDNDDGEESCKFWSRLQPCAGDKHTFTKKYTWDASDYERGWSKGLKRNFYICPNCSETKTNPVKADGTEYTDAEIAVNDKMEEKLRKRDNNKCNYPSPTKEPKVADWRLYDASVNIGTESPYGNRRLFLNIIVALRKRGFDISHDKNVEKNYESLMPTHRYGIWKGIEFKADYYQSGMKFEFFQNVVASDGREIGRGEYAYNKMKYMPYLLAKRCRLAINTVTDYLNSIGIKEQIVKPLDWHGRPELKAYKTDEEKVKAIKTTNDKVDGYNNKDRNKKEIKNGDLKYYYTYPDYRLSYGHAYHNIGNMWWVVNGKDEYKNMSGHELFDFDPSLPKRKPKNDAIAKLTRKLNGLIEKHDFEACIKVRDSINIVKRRKKDDEEE
jgi:hypothetical protein